MAAVDYVAVPKYSTHVTFENLRLGRSSQQVVCRLLRFWDSRNINRDNQFMGITLLFLDEKNTLLCNHGNCKVKDNSGKAIFVVFDTPMTKLVSKTVATLTAEAIDEGDADLPHCLQALKGKTYIFNIRVSPFNFTPNHRTFTVSTMTETDPLDAPVEIEAAASVLPVEVHNQAPEVALNPNSNKTTGDGSGGMEDLGSTSRKRQKN